MQFLLHGGNKTPILQFMQCKTCILTITPSTEWHQNVKIENLGKNLRCYIDRLLFTGVQFIEFSCCTRNSCEWQIIRAKCLDNFSASCGVTSREWAAAGIKQILLHGMIEFGTKGNNQGTKSPVRHSHPHKLL